MFVSLAFLSLLRYLDQTKNKLKHDSVSSNPLIHIASSPGLSTIHQQSPLPFTQVLQAALNSNHLPTWISWKKKTGIIYIMYISLYIYIYPLSNSYLLAWGLLKICLSGKTGIQKLDKYFHQNSYHFFIPPHSISIVSALPYLKQVTSLEFPTQVVTLRFWIRPKTLFYILSKPFPPKKPWLELQSQVDTMQLCIKTSLHTHGTASWQHVSFHHSLYQ